MFEQQRKGKMCERKKAECYKKNQWMSIAVWRTLHSTCHTTTSIRSHSLKPLARSSHGRLVAGYFIFSANYILNENVSMTRHKIAREYTLGVGVCVLYFLCAKREGDEFFVFHFPFHSHDDALRFLTISVARISSHWWCSFAYTSAAIEWECERQWLGRTKREKKTHRNDQIIQWYHLAHVPRAHFIRDTPKMPMRIVTQSKLPPVNDKWKEK